MTIDRIAVLAASGESRTLDLMTILVGLPNSRLRQISLATLPALQADA